MFKTFASNAKKETIVYILLILLIFTGIIPAAESIFSFTLGFSLPMNSIFVFYFLLGSYIHEYNVVIHNKILALSLLFAVVCAVVLPLIPSMAEIYNRGGAGIMTLPLTIPIFCLVRQNCRKPSALFNFISPLCFGIYLELIRE